MAKRIGLLVAVAAVALLVGCGGAGTQTRDTSKPATPAAQTPEPDDATSAGKVAPVEMGQPAMSGTWTITVKEAERTAEAGGAKAESGKELLVLRFDLKNGGAKGEGTGPTSFKLTGPDGTEYQASPTSDSLFIFNTPQPIKAGETREIMIAYAVPVGVGPLQWAFTPFVEGGQAQPAVVNIK